MRKHTFAQDSVKVPTLRRLIKINALFTQSLYLKNKIPQKNKTSKSSHPAKESTGKNLSKFHIRRSHVEQNGRHVPSCVSRVYTRSVEKLTSVISFDVDFRPRPPLVLRTFLCPRRGLLALFCFAFWKTCIFMRSGRRFILSGC